MWFCLSAPQDQKVKDGCHYDITHISPISIPYGDLICRARSTSRLSCLLWSHLLITVGKESEHWAANRGRNVFKKSFDVFQCFSLGPLSFWQAFSNFRLFTESQDAWGLLEEKQTSIENICCRKFSTSLPLSSPLCFSFLKSEGLRRLKRLNIQAPGGRGHQHYESPGTSH